MLKIKKTVEYKGETFKVVLEEQAYGGFLTFTNDGLSNKTATDKRLLINIKDVLGNSYSSKVEKVDKIEYKQIIEDEVRKFYDQVHYNLNDLTEWDGCVEEKDEEEFAQFLYELREDIDKLNKELNKMKEGNFTELKVNGDTALKDQKKYLKYGDNFYYDGEKLVLNGVLLKDTTEKDQVKEVDYNNESPVINKHYTINVYNNTKENGDQVIKRISQQLKALDTNELKVGSNVEFGENAKIKWGKTESIDDKVSKLIDEKWNNLKKDLTRQIEDQIDVYQTTQNQKAAEELMKQLKFIKVMGR